MYLFLMMWFFLFFMGGVASNPSPYFGSAALVLASVFGAGVLASLNSTFVSLVLVLVYLGGMLVVFVYSVAMSSDVYPEAWGNRSVVLYIGGFMMYLFCLWLYVGGEWFFNSAVFVGVALEGVAVDLGGMVLLYSFGGGCFLILVVGLLLTLFVVLDLVCGWSLGAVR